MSAAQIQSVNISPTKIIQHIEEICDAYDMIILDYWGVIYNGSSLYPEVKKTLEMLKLKSKHLFILSNSPRLSSTVKANLSNLGLLENTHYDEVLTSGELTHRFLLTPRVNTPFSGDTCLFLGNNFHRQILENTGIMETSQASEADFIILSGIEEHEFSYYESIIQEFAEKQIPMICVNPDKYVMVNNVKTKCTGLIAELYESLDQEVHYFGKPYLSTYEAIKSSFPSTPKHKILFIGDALETDIKGAHEAGYDNVFVAGGIHSDLIPSSLKNDLIQTELDKAFNLYKLTPTFTISCLK